MSSIVIPRGEFICLPQDDQAVLLTPEIFPFLRIDPLRSKVSPEIQRQLLKSLYEEQLIADGLECGKLHLVDGQLMFRSGIALHHFTGFVFEAYFVRQFNADKSGKGKAAFLWCTEKRPRQAGRIEQWKAIGKGHLETRMRHPMYYDVSSSSDVIFIRQVSEDDGRWEQAVIDRTTIPAGIQVKAITENEKSEIIDKLRSGRYQHVLTCLESSSGKHSYYTCHDIIRAMKKDGDIGYEEAINLECRISCPELLGFHQADINEYQKYISYWYAGRALPNDDVSKAMRSEIAGYRRQGALLVPE